MRFNKTGKDPQVVFHHLLVEEDAVARGCVPHILMLIWISSAILYNPETPYHHISQDGLQFFSCGRSVGACGTEEGDLLIGKMPEGFQQWG